MKFVFLGPESSGKSTLTESCFQKFGGSLITEYAREYLLEKGLNYSIDDLDEMAKVQFERISFCNAEVNFIDTELITFKIWSEFKYKSCSDLIVKLLESQQIDFYFLCKPDIPWEFDVLRESENDRDELFELYKEELESRNFPFQIISGEKQERMKMCEVEINKLLK